MIAVERSVAIHGKSVKHPLFTLFAFYSLLSCCLIYGCSHDRFYEGQPLPTEKVASLAVHGDFSSVVHSVEVDGKKYTFRSGDIAAGKHNLVVEFGGFDDTKTSMRNTIGVIFGTPCYLGLEVPYPLAPGILACPVAALVLGVPPDKTCIANLSVDFVPNQKYVVAVTWGSDPPNATVVEGNSKEIIASETCVVAPINTRKDEKK